MKIIYRLFTCLVVVFSTVSCSDDFFDVNENQNSPSSASPELSLPVAQKFSQDLLSGDINSMSTLGNLWSYTWAAGGDYIWYTDETRYNVTSTFRQGLFNNAYLNPLSNYHVIDKNLNPEYANFRAIAKIMKAFHYQYLVDAYGNIPYSQALDGTNPKPTYDNAQVIYNDLLAQLTEAQGLIASSAGNGTILVPSATVDVMLHGDMAKWSKFANTIKLRILLRQSEIGVTDYSSVNNSIGFLGAGETVFCNPGYSNDANKQNPMWGSFGKTVAGDPAGNANATRATDYAIAKLAGDPRRARLYKPVGATTNFAGIAQNQEGGTSSANLSAVGEGILIGATQNGIIMLSAESLLLQAEAAARGFIPGNAEALFNLAVQESFSHLGAGSAAAYLGLTPYPNGTTDQNVEAIIYQKWVALNGTNGFETWIEYRRTGFPADLPVAPGANSTVLPVRLLYPTSEYATNAANVPAQSSTDAFTSRVFWDTNN